MRPRNRAVFAALCVALLAALALLAGRPAPDRPGSRRSGAASGRPMESADAAALASETRQAALARRAARRASEPAEPSWDEQCRADPACVAWQAEQREALAAAIPARRAAYQAILESAEEQDGIKNRIAAHAAALAVTADIDDLFEALSREAAITIEVDDCAARQDRSPACASLRGELAALQRDFAEENGITMTDLRAGQREPTRAATLVMQAMAERQGGKLYFARDKAAGEVAPRLIGEEEAAELQAAAETCAVPAD